MTLVYMFPGQSSRYPGMLSKLAGLNPVCRDLLQEASDILGRDLAAHYCDDNPSVFQRNEDVQIGVFLANHMFLQLLAEAEITADLSLGLSLGEYNHLVHIGALEFAPALRLVQQRGQAYDDGPRGSMASVFPISAEELSEVAARVADVGVLEVTNLNSPRQQVLSGETAALEAALALLDEEFYVHSVIIERKVPMHCSIFKPAGEALRLHLEAAPFATPRLTYMPNLYGAPLAVPTPAHFVDTLSRHVHSPVLWRKSIEYVLEQHPQAMFLEVGPLSVLFNLLDKKWNRAWRKLHTDSVERTDEHLQLTIAQVRGVARTLEMDTIEESE